MIGVVGAIVLSAGLNPAYAELPEFRFPDKFYQCKKNNDCAVAGDACRSCGNLIVINKKYLKKFNELDQKERRKKNLLRACEACSTGHVILKCEKNRCQQDVKAP